MSLEIAHVVKAFRDGNDVRRVLDDVSLAVERGQIVGLTGPSGSGKSTLLACAGALITPDSGSVTIDGLDLTEATQAQRAQIRRERIGFVFQTDNLLPALTAVDQLLVSDRIRGIRPRRSRALALLDRVGLAGSAHLRPAQLSGGMRQRVNIARSLMAEPSVMLIDEPTAALDSVNSRAVMSLLTEIVRETGTAAMLVSHDDAALQRCDRSMVLLDGRIRADDTRHASI